MAIGTSMSPPASSETASPAKRGRGGSSRGRGGGRKKAAEGGDTPRGGGSGRGRKKRQSTVDSPSVAGTPHSGPSSGAHGVNTPGGLSSHAPSPAGGLGHFASILEDANRNMREGSQVSASRKSTNTRVRENGTAVEGEGEEDEDEEDDEDDDFNMFLDDGAYDEQAKERAEAKEALRLLLDQFSPEQLERYEVYRRSGLQKAAIRRLINHVLQQSCTPNIIVAVRGLSKVFVGEIVEIARQVQADANESGPLTPDHLREAYVRYKAVRNIRGSKRAKLFVR